MRMAMRHPALIFLLLTGVFLRAFIPVGFMPAFGGDARALVICSPAAATGSTSLPDTQEGTQKPHDGICVFAASLFKSVPVFATLLAAPLFTAFHHDDGPYVSHSGITAVRPFARGPPIR